MCQLGVSKEGRSSSVAVGLFNDWKWVFNGASLMPWCHAVVHVWEKRSPFIASFKANHPSRSRRSPVCPIGVSNECRSAVYWSHLYFLCAVNSCNTNVLLDFFFRGKPCKPVHGLTISFCMRLPQKNVTPLSRKRKNDLFY